MMMMKKKEKEVKLMVMMITKKARKMNQNKINTEKVISRR